MKIQFLRNATLIIEVGEHVVLVDPMLADKGELPSFSFFRHKPKRNPLVPLPENAGESLAKVTSALITHCQRGHTDHLDREGEKLLAGRNIATYCRKEDAGYLGKRHIDARPLETGRRSPFLGGHIMPVPARHGHGWIAGLMGPGVGYVIDFPGEPSLYIAGDTVLTADVRRVLVKLTPDIAIVAAGNASVDIGKPILMSLDEVMEFAQLAPGKVVANHLEALNHCPVTRSQVATAAHAAGLGDKMTIPEDGEWIDFGGLSGRVTG